MLHITYTSFQVTLVLTALVMDLKQAKKEIERLTRLINHHNTQFFQKNHSQISDYAFDQLVNQLQQLENSFPKLRKSSSPTQRVGEAPSKHFKTVYHKYPMLSLDNTYAAAGVEHFVQRVQKNAPDRPDNFFCEPKFDGVAISLLYAGGKLQQVVTRGDSQRGDEITANAKTIDSIPKQVTSTSWPAEFEVRGEVFMPLANFQALNKTLEQQGKPLLANPRNAASGTLKMLDTKLVAQRTLDFYPYTLLTPKCEITTHADRMQALATWGFQLSPACQSCSSLEDVLQYIHYWETQRHSLPMVIDGVVIKVNDIAHQQRMGMTAKSPRWAIAYKYKPLNACTQLKDVVYQVGRTGVITPVAQLEPIHLAGTVVRRASLYNADTIKRLKLRVGSMVYIEKGGDIIPKITSVQHNLSNQPIIIFPTHCPACNTRLKRDTGTAMHYCSNTQCPPQLKGQIAHFVHRKALDIASIGLKTIDALYTANLVRTPSDLYQLRYTDLQSLEGFQATSIRKLLQGIAASKQAPFSRVLFALGIRHIGITVAQKLAEHFKDIDQLSNANAKELQAIEEIGDKIAQSIVMFFSKPANQRLIQKLQKAGLCFSIHKQTQQKRLAGYSFVISGTFPGVDRKILEAWITQHGGQIKQGISKATHYLLAGDKPGPKKWSQAKEMQIPIISLPQLRNMHRH